MTAFLYLTAFGLFTVFVFIASTICFFTFMKIFKGGPYYSKRNPKGLPNYRKRIDIINLDPTLTHGNNEPHV